MTFYFCWVLVVLTIVFLASLYRSFADLQGDAFQRFIAVLIVDGSIAFAIFSVWKLYDR